MRTFALRQEPNHDSDSISFSAPLLNFPGLEREVRLSPDLRRPPDNQTIQRLRQDSAPQLEDESVGFSAPGVTHDFSRVPVHAKTGAAIQSGHNATGMPESVRGKMEQVFGADFSDVHIHHDSSRAAELGAIAFTQGHEIHFARGNWAPATTRGQEILGHELAHVVQQRAGRVSTSVPMSGTALNNEPTLEREADTMGRVAAQSSASYRQSTMNLEVSASPRLQRSADAAPHWLQSHFGSISSQSRAGGVCQLLPATSPWWPPTEEKRKVVINAHDFDFKTDGTVDGPGYHNGTYKVLDNQAKSFKMQITVGNNDTHNNDLDVILAIKDGQATITGIVQGEALDTPYTSPVSGTGTKSSPFSLTFTSKKDGKTTTISWAVG